MRCKRWQNQLSLDDKISVEITTEKGKVISFVIQYYAKIESRWRTILRVDTSHNCAHKHFYHQQKRKDHREILAVDKGDYGKIFNECRRYVKENFTKIKENYFL